MAEPLGDAESDGYRLTPPVETLSVKIQLRVQTPDGVVLTDDESVVTHTPATWKAAGDELLSRIERTFGARRCLISSRPIPDDKATSPEHVVLQGLGTHWIELPPGTVHDDVNNSASGSELVFLQEGLMGSFRPFYLAANKTKRFETTKGNTVEFVSVAGSSFEIRYSGDDAPLNLPADAGPGDLSLSLLLDQPDPIHISRSIHKMTFLCLAPHLLEPCLSTAFDRARRLIADGSDEDFRPFVEQFIPGAPPGFEFRYLVMAIGRPGTDAAPPTITGLNCVLAQARLHHVRYTASLVGDLPVGLEAQTANAIRYDSPRATEAVRPVVYSFGVSSIRRKPQPADFATDYQRVTLSPLTSELVALIAGLTDRAKARPFLCDSNSLMIASALFENSPQLRCEVVGGLALLPQDARLPDRKPIPEPTRWRVHVWLEIEGTHYDPTYEIAWKLAPGRVRYYEQRGARIRFGELEPASAREAVLRGARQNSGLLRAVEKRATDLGIDIVPVGF